MTDETCVHAWHAARRPLASRWYLSSLVDASSRQKFQAAIYASVRPSRAAHLAIWVSIYMHHACNASSASGLIGGPKGRRRHASPSLIEFRLIKITTLELNPTSSNSVRLVVW